MSIDFFKNGAKWLRIDCHLHSKADKEFIYGGDECYYNKSYIDKLEEGKISVGIITNHNKFDLREYKALKKTAKNRDIFLLAGVELSVDDGGNGIHCLIVFDDKAWLENQEDFINQFITGAFQGKKNFENENARCNYSLENTIKELNKFHKDYFIILAHCEAKSGFFYELEGGRIQEFSQKNIFKDRVLALQKVRTSDEVEKWKKWFGQEKLPTFIEGSDPKGVGEIGRGKKSFIKIGDFNFKAVKFALQNFENRVKCLWDKDKSYSCVQEFENKKSYIKKISFSGGKLDKQELDFTSEMNNFIGIRGSGKSSILEAIRYGLDIDLEHSNADKTYKENLVKELLGSGGKITIQAVNKYDKIYNIERIFGHQVEIKKDNEIQNIDIEGIVDNPLYFGQKDLVSYSDNFEKYLLEKLLGNETRDIKEGISEKHGEIKIILEKLNKSYPLKEKEEENDKKITELQDKIKNYDQHELTEKLQKQINFNNDISDLRGISVNLEKYKEALAEFLNDFDYIKSLTEFKFSDDNKDICNEVVKEITSFQEEVNIVERSLKRSTHIQQNILGIQSKLNEKESLLKESFAKLQQEIKLPNLRADDYISYKNSLKKEGLKKLELLRLKEERDSNVNKLWSLLSGLNDLYLEEFKLIEGKIVKINNNLLEIKINFKGDKGSFLKQLKLFFSGTGLSSMDYDKLSEYKGFVEIYKDLKNISFGGNKTDSFKKKFRENINSLLTYQTPNKIDFFYENKSLKQHSLGQRASVIISFLLSQKENSVIVIDQLEDDLDNQTIYEQVIKRIISSKKNTQFIFATHNANIPVLGDAEQVFICKYEENKIAIKAGSIDDEDIQGNIIKIMEGGNDAFCKRNNIYNLWKS